VTIRASEWFEKVANFRRVGSLARDQPGSRFGKTLRSKRVPVSYGNTGKLERGGLLQRQPTAGRGKTLEKEIP
jgi:hypothetical protein